MERDSGMDDERDEDAESPLESCREDLVTGPAWNQVRDERAATRESEWIASLIVDSSAAAGQNSTALDELFTLLDSLEIEVLQNREDAHLLVAGTPGAILEALSSNCSLVGFDLTGFQCDCAPEQCARARECRLVSARVLDSEGNPAPSLQKIRQVSPFYEPILSCKQDYQPWDQAWSVAREDFRGVLWSLGGVIESWGIASACTEL